MFSRILVPLDGSTRAEKILPYVEELAFTRNSRIIFLQVIEPSLAVTSSYDMLPYYSQEMAESACKEAYAYMEKVTGDFHTKGLDAVSFVEVGPVVQTILLVAEREKADLIAMASHGRSGVARVFYGSVAAGILHQADRPLLLIRSSEEEFNHKQ